VSGPWRRDAARRSLLAPAAALAVLASVGVAVTSKPGPDPSPRRSVGQEAGPAASPAAPARRAPTASPLSTAPVVGPERAAPQAEGPPYDGRFTFVRLRFGDGGAGLRRGWGRRGGGPVWAHDMPRAERNFAQILSEVTLISPYMEGGKVLDVDDPELFKYPVAYIVEVGYWRPSDSEVGALREYLLKGGFLIVDDFRGRDIYTFLDAMKRVLPEADVVELDPGHEIFDSFFHIEDPSTLAPPTYQQYVPVYLAVFEDNDPRKRLMAMINYNNDIAEYWEYSDYGYFPIDLSNEAYKFGVNYIVYALTHH
jgi:hypothetical protein